MRPLLTLGLLLGLLAPTAVRAQFADRGSVTYGSVGTTFLDTDDLTDRLDGAGYGALEPGSIGIGTARYQFRGRFVGGIEGHTTGTETAETRGLETTLGGRYALFNLGYDLVGSPTLKAYPLVGLGYGDLTLKIAPLADADFDDVLASPLRGASLTRRGFLFNAGVGGDLLVPFRSDTRSTTSVAVGIRAGYLVALGSDDWQLFNTADLTAAPEASLSGPYVRLLFGFGRTPRPDR